MLAIQCKKRDKNIKGKTYFQNWETHSFHPGDGIRKFNQVGFVPQPNQTSQIFSKTQPCGILPNFSHWCFGPKLILTLDPVNLVNTHRARAFGHRLGGSLSSSVFDATPKGCLAQLDTTRRALDQLGWERVVSESPEINSMCNLAKLNKKREKERDKDRALRYSIFHKKLLTHNLLIQENNQQNIR